KRFDFFLCQSRNKLDSAEWFGDNERGRRDIGRLIIHGVIAILWIVIGSAAVIAGTVRPGVVGAGTIPLKIARLGMVDVVGVGRSGQRQETENRQDKSHLTC